MIINTNISSLVSQRYLNKTQDQMSTVMERLSSGKRINGAGDDAAGLAISTRMEAAVRGMDTAKRNTMDGISLLQTSESAMGSISSILQRMRELAVQADNGTNSTGDVTNLQAEFDQLSSEVDHIASTTQFNGVALLNATGTLAIHVSNNSQDTVDVKQYDVTAATLGVDSLTLGVGTSDAAIDQIDTALDLVSGNRAELGALENRFNFTIDNLNVSSTNLTSAKSRIEDADMAAEMSSLTRSKILTQSAMSMLAQANQNPQMILSLLQG
jgi:flagellin